MNCLTEGGTTSWFVHCPGAESVQEVARQLNPMDELKSENCLFYVTARAQCRQTSTGKENVVRDVSVGRMDARDYMGCFKLDRLQAVCSHS